MSTDRPWRAPQKLWYEAGFLSSASWQGLLIAAGGFFLAVFQFVLFPLAARRLATTRLFTGSLALIGLVYLTTPLLASAGAWRVPLLLAWTALGKGVASFAFTSSFLIINNSCTSAERGRVNGWGMSLSSAFKAAGPTVGSVCFAWSLTNGIESWLLDVHFAFFLCALIAGSTVALAMGSFTAKHDRPV